MFLRFRSIGSWDRFWFWCIVLDRTRTHILPRDTKNEINENMLLYEAVNVFTSCHMTFLSLISLLQAVEKNEKKNITRRIKCRKSFEVGDKSCLKSVFKQNETNFLWVCVRLHHWPVTVMGFTNGKSSVAFEHLNMLPVETETVEAKS